MGTTWRATLVDPPTASGLLLREVQETLNRVDRLMSTYQADSELSVFNRSQSTGPQRLSAETLQVVAESLRLAKLTGGALDPTVLPLVNLWGFGPAGLRAGIPSQADVDLALSKTGWRRLGLDAVAGTLAKHDPALQLDLSAVAKGYGVDAVCDRLLELGCSQIFVEVGGEVRAVGANANGDPWRVGIDKPSLRAAPGQAMQQVVELTDLAMATSGDYRNFREFDGRRYSHTIDPATGRPVTHGLASVSVLAPSCMTADALATAISVLGPEKGWELVQGMQGVEVLIVSRLPDGKLQERITDGFRALLAER
ncbi:MAG: FAD:protein FMN transferase [Planctomycetes bacterium]|nr:FAD:protein FMN transferase [Planctomycetota bacterium]MBL7007904.1 FAD:protein FMN transferase [Planctomycetota bacterium]